MMSLNSPLKWSFRWQSQINLACILWWERSWCRTGTALLYHSSSWQIACPSADRKVPFRLSSLIPKCKTHSLFEDLTLGHHREGYYIYERKHDCSETLNQDQSFRPQAQSRLPDLTITIVADEYIHQSTWSRDLPGLAQQAELIPWYRWTQKYMHILVFHGANEWWMVKWCRSPEAGKWSFSSFVYFLISVRRTEPIIGVWYFVLTTSYYVVVRWDHSKQYHPGQYEKATFLELVLSNHSHEKFTFSLLLLGKCYVKWICNLFYVDAVMVRLRNEKCEALITLYQSLRYAELQYQSHFRQQWSQY
jgi:hypothetical protein